MEENATKRLKIEDIPGKKEYDLGVYYREQCEFQKAKEYFMASVKNDYPPAAVRLLSMRMHYEIFVSEELEEEYHEYLESQLSWFEDQPETPDSMFDIGFFLSKVASGKKNKAIGTKCLQEAAELGNPFAQVLVGLRCEKKNQPKDSFLWYMKAAEQKWVVAQWFVGLAFLQGIGVERNVEKAFEWFQIAASRGYARAQHYLGWCYQYSSGTTWCAKCAARWYLKAANQGDSSAQLDVGLAFQHGFGLPRDYELSLLWLCKAANVDYNYNAAAEIRYVQNLLFDEWTPSNQSKLENWWNAFQ